MRRSKVVQGGVWADEVVEEYEHGNEIVGGREGRKALFGFVPCLELLVEALNEVVRRGSSPRGYTGPHAAS